MSGWEPCRAGSTNPCQKAGRGQCQPHLYGSAVWIYGAFGDFQKYAPLAGLSGGRICTLLCFLSGLEQLFIQTDGKEKYHHFFHKKENHDLQMLMSVKLCETIEPYMEEKLREMNENGITRVGNIPLTASYMLFGAVPVLENDGLSTAEKALGIRMIMKCILEA